MEGQNSCCCRGVGLLILTTVLTGFGRCDLSRSYQYQFQDREISRGVVEGRIRRDLSRSEEDKEAIRDVFVMGDEAVPFLIKFLHSTDNEVRTHAARALAYIGDERGLKALRSAVSAERDKESKSAMTYFLAGGLVASRAKDDVRFLKHSVEVARRARDDEDQAFPAVSAALALGMIGTTDALATLREIATIDIVDSEEIAKAIRWIERKPTIMIPPQPPGLKREEMIKSVVLEQTFFAERNGDQTSVEQLTLNRSGKKALASLAVRSSRYARGYDVVLSEQNGVWRVTGVWFTWIT